MGNEACGAALLSISVCYALPGHVWLREIQLPEGATVALSLIHI